MTDSRQQQLIEQTFVRHVEWLEETPSTNDLAVQMAHRVWPSGEGNLRLPALCVADRQTAGRGRGANRWWSADGALTFSLLLDSASLGLPAEQWPLASLTTGLAIAQGLQALLPGADFGLKWPNDVHLSGRKVCGVLIESPARDRLVVGIGMNANNSLADAPSDVQARATSLCDHAERDRVPRSSTGHGEVFDRLAVLIGVLQSLEATWKRLREDRAAVLRAWRERCVLTGRQVTLDQAGKLTGGECLGIDDDGALQLLTAQGLRRFVSGSIAGVS